MCHGGWSRTLHRKSALTCGRGLRISFSRVPAWRIQFGCGTKPKRHTETALSRSPQRPTRTVSQVILAGTRSRAAVSIDRCQAMSRWRVNQTPIPPASNDQPIITSAATHHAADCGYSLSGETMICEAIDGIATAEVNTQSPWMR